MNEKKLQHERQEKIKPDSLKNISSRTIRKRTGEVITQYPAEVGYHGTDKEQRLSPEE